MHFTFKRILKTHRFSFFSVLLIPFSLLNVDQIAHAETIWIEAQTQLILNVHGLNGGHIEGVLLDDLNHSIPNREIKIFIKNRSTQEDFVTTRTTDWKGRFVLELSLGEGSYAGFAEFEGQNYYRASQETFEFDITRCHANLSLQSPTLFPLGQNFYVDLQRASIAEKYPDVSCAQYEIAGMASIGRLSEKFQFEPEQNVIRLEFKTAGFKPGKYAFECAVFEGKNWFSETLNADIFFYDRLFMPQLDVEYDGFSREIVARVDPSLPQEGIGARLVLNGQDGTTMDLMSTSDSHGQVRFNIEEVPSGCYEAVLSRADQWQDFGAIQSSLCVKPSRNSLWMWGSWSVLFLGIVVSLGIAKYRKRALPDPPDKTTHIETMELPGENSDNSVCEFICVDKKNGVILDENRIQITIDEKKQEDIHWPVHTQPQSNLTIAHPDYMPWSGKLLRNERVRIKMTLRRDYAIECYEAVCESFYGEPVSWGTLSPEEFTDDLNEHHLSDALTERITLFCTLVSSAAFKPGALETEKLTEIYELSRKIITSNRRPVFRRRR